MLEEVKPHEGEQVVRECKAMAEEESSSAWNQVPPQARKINQGDWKKATSGVKREEWKVRKDFANNEAVWGPCSCDFDEEVKEWILNLKRRKD